MLTRCFLGVDKMMAVYRLFAFAVVAFSVALTSAEVCTNPQVQSQSYTTTDSTVVSSIAFIAEFTVICGNNAQNLNLHADIGGKLLQVTKAQEGNKYQVSWVKDAAKLSSGEYPVKIYDEEGFAALRKAQRTGDDTSNVAPLFVVSVNHAGTYTGPWVQSEVMAAVVSLTIWYFAYTTKAKLQT